MRDHLYQNLDFSPFDASKLEDFYVFLREFSIQRALVEEYTEAERARDLSDQVMKELERRNPRPSMIPTFSEANGREELEQTWNAKFAEFQSQTIEKRDQLLARQAAETDEFEGQWMTQMPRKYRKPSVRLLQLKKIERSFAVSKNFSDARNVHSEVAELAHSEMEIAQSNLIRDYESAQRKLIERHQQELAVFQATRDHERLVLEAKYEADKTALQNRCRVVQTRKLATRLLKTSITNLNPPTAYQAIDRLGQQDLLLPPLRPPNDPELLAEKRKQKQEMDRKKLEFQRRNAEETMKKYSTDLPGQVAIVADVNGMRVIENPAEQPKPELLGDVSQPIRHSFLDS
jgi:hypothetical protein